jgi:hypothetical protein
MSNAQAPIRGHGRGRAFARGGRGAPRGGRNAINLPEPPRDGGSPIASHLSTLHDASFTTDDTIELFTQVILTHQPSHNITVRQKHVENVCGGLNSRTKANATKNIITTFTPDSLDEQRRHLNEKHNNNCKTIKYTTIKTKQTHIYTSKAPTKNYPNIPIKPTPWQIARKNPISSRLQPTTALLTTDAS